MKQLKQILFLVFFMVLFLSFCNGGNAFNSSFTIIISPKNSSIGAQTIARVESYNFDIDRANILWKVDGVTVSSGTGKTKIDFMSPELSESKQISAFVTTFDGEESSQSVIIAGNDMDLVWQSMTYTPSWYKGKSLPGRESQVKITAFPYLFNGGAKISNNNLVYEWSLNRKKDFNASGMGKGSFSFEMANYGDYVVSCFISSEDESISFEKTITISVGDIEPIIIFYEKSPLEGMRSNMALGREFSLQSGEVGIKAEPYYFSNDSMEKLSYKWMMNGREVVTEDSPNVLSLRSSGQSGISNVELRVRHLFNTLQFASQGIMINF